MYLDENGNEIREVASVPARAPVYLDSNGNEMQTPEHVVDPATGDPYQIASKVTPFKNAEQAAQAIATRQEPTTYDAVMKAMFPRSYAAQENGVEPDYWTRLKDTWSFPIRQVSGAVSGAATGIGTMAGGGTLDDALRAGAEAYSEEMASPSATPDRGGTSGFVSRMVKDPLVPLGIAMGGFPAVGLAGRAMQAAEGSGAVLARNIADAGSSWGEPESITPGQIALAGISGVAPEILGAAGSKLLAIPAKASAELVQKWQGLMKALPGAKNRTVWEGVRDFAGTGPGDRADLAAVLEGAQDVSGIAANFRKLRDDLIAARSGTTARMDATGKTVDLRRALDAAKADVWGMPTGAENMAHRHAALEDLEQTLFVPRKGTPPVYDDPKFPGMVFQEPVTVGQIPLNAARDLPPSEAQWLKTLLANRVKWGQPGESAYEAAMAGASRDVREQLEEIAAASGDDLARENARIGKYLAADLGVARAESRAMNRDNFSTVDWFSPRKWLGHISTTRETPQALMNSLFLEKAIMPSFNRFSELGLPSYSKLLTRGLFYSPTIDDLQ